MKQSIATVCLSGGLPEKLEAIAAAGFTGVEIFENDLLTYHGRPAEVRERARELGLEIVALQPFRDFEGLTGAARERVFARAERKFDLMAELGTDLLMVCSSVSPDSVGGIDRAAEDFAELGRRAAARGMRVAYEALAWGRHVNDYRDAWETVRRADHPAVGLCLDSFHALARNTDLRAMRAIPRDRIFLVQLADAPRLDMDFLSWSRHFRNFPGQGDLAILEFMTALAATGYDDWLSLEIFNDQFRAGSARRVAIDGRRSLIYLTDRMHAAGCASPGAAPLPSRARCLGTAFIEFAVDDETAPALEAMIGSLGFRLSGRHISKSVARWTQGSIDLVVNTDKEGFAHSYNIAHGTSVCAIGLVVDDAGATMERARGLLDQPFTQPVGPGELEIPAVRGLGGSLVYFLDPKSELARVWDIEFVPVAAEGEAVARLTSIDHIAQSMHYEEMLTWLLFYTALLDIDKSPEQDVIDPGGLVKSVVAQSKDGRLRLPLNASQAVQTQAARFVSELFGSGVQHIAFTTTDLVATVRRLKADGVALLPIPQNYYDDLEAKSDLALDTIATLRALDILYDRDAGGEFLQAYTHTFDQRFFFELVERRGGYRGFGATNAPIRLAAQSRFARQPDMPRR